MAGPAGASAGIDIGLVPAARPANGLRGPVAAKVDLGLLPLAQTR